MSDVIKGLLIIGVIFLGGIIVGFSISDSGLIQLLCLVKNLVKKLIRHSIRDLRNRSKN